MYHFLMLLIFLTVTGFQKLRCHVREYNSKYLTTIQLDSNKLIKGFILDLKDSSLSFQLHKLDLGPIDLNITNIQFVKLKRKNGILRGMLIGTGPGLAAGFIVAALIFNSDNSFSQIIEGTGFLGNAITLFTIAGAGFGAVFGNAKITIPIYGKQYWYDKNKDKLKRYKLAY